MEESFGSINGILHSGNPPQKLSEIKDYLESIYCGTSAVDFSAVEVTLIYVKSWLERRAYTNSTAVLII
jgi:2-oxoglutarate dehydrogenase complex dehydrogenase (E1) component-like enzyme